jgi:hypothetical protein
MSRDAHVNTLCRIDSGTAGGSTAIGPRARMARSSGDFLFDREGEVVTHRRESVVMTRLPVATKYSPWTSLHGRVCQVVKKFSAPSSGMMV